MYKKILWIVAFSLSLIFTQAVFAECGEGLKKMVASLKIDEQQKAKIKPVLEELKKTIQGKKDQLMDIRKQIKEQVASEKYDQSTVDGLVDKKVQIIGEIIKAKIKATHEIAMTLTGEQKAAFHAKVQKMHEKMAEKFKKCHDEE